MKKFSSIILILKIYALVLSIFSSFRLILFITELRRVDFQEVGLITISRAFIMGIRFDVVISGYIIFFPAVALLVMEIINKRSDILKKIIFYWMAIFFSAAFTLTAIDIPYFNQFFSRLSITAFEWFDSFGFVFSMIAQEPKYYIIMLPLLVSLFIFYKILARIFNRKLERNDNKIYLKILASILFLGLIFLGVRGRIQEKSPIRIGTAYFGNHSFLNQMGLNPVFTLMRSYIDSQNEENNTIQLMDNQTAIAKVQEFLSIKSGKFDSPIARMVNYDSISNLKPNIVLIIMESMGSAKMGRYGDQGYVSPFLDSLSYQSYNFENIYTAGKHTFNGIFSTLFSSPALYRQHPLKQIKKHDGISSALLKHGYSTTFFTNHDAQFDNVEGFLRANDFQNIISQANYPVSEVKTTLGVPDDYMFRFSIPIINELYAEKKPFFVSFMTASDHGPYYLPEYFTPNESVPKFQMVEYADWSLKKFIELATKEEWFDNTIFVFVADHGVPVTAPYDISLDYHHSPLLIYAPKLLPEPKTFKGIGGQIDVFPTIMGIIKQPYVNNTLGIDLLKDDRPFIFINDDDKIGVLNDSLFLIMKDRGESKLFKYRNNDKENYISQYPEISKIMKEYTEANMQVFQYMLLHEKQLSVPYKINDSDKSSPLTKIESHQ